MKSIWDDVVSSLREAGYVVETREEAARRETTLCAFHTYARALREHEAHKGDPARNVATGTALYAAESAMRKFALEET